MTQQEEKCIKCGKNIRVNKAGTITQWLKSTSDCSCDSQNQLVSPTAEEDRKIDRCPTCGKDRTPARDGSLTQWIFKDNKCKCGWNQLDMGIDSSQPPVNYKAEPPDEEVRAVLKSPDIDYHGLSLDAFPFERYRIIRELGRGNAGIVFKCWDLFLKKPVAIKTLNRKTWSAEDLLRLQNEARAASKLSHPAVVRVLDFGASKGGQPFMVMDYVNGQTLENVLKEQGPLDEYTALCIFSQVLAAIGHAHRHSVLHRDLKPSNILVQNALSDTPQAKVIDFGIAALTHSATVTKTASGKTILTGSPSYMSPDQARGELFEETSDIYSLGCVFYETLSGLNPFLGDSVLDTIGRHATMELPPFSETAPDAKIDSEVETIVARMLEKEADMRYQSADEVRMPIEAVLERMDVARGGSSLKRRRAQASDDSHLIDAGWGHRRAPDPIIYAIAAGVALFALSIGLLVMDRAADDVIPNKKKEVAKEAPAKLDDSVTKPSYIEDILMPNSKKNDAWLRALKPTDNVREINLRMSDVTDDGIKSIENAKIQLLDLSYTGISDKALDSVAKMPALTILYLTGTDVTTNGIKKLANSKTLSVLDLSALDADAEMLRAAAKISKLQRLHLISVPTLNADAFKELQAAKDLQVLGLRRVPLGKAELETICSFPSLQTLLLSYCGITDDTIGILKNIPDLQLLDLSGNNITDSGLMQVAKFKKLRQLYIANCTHISRAGIERFKKLSRNCSVSLELGPNMLGGMEKSD